MDTKGTPDVQTGTEDSHIKQMTEAHNWPEEMKKERTRIMKNIILISVGFCLNFTSFNGLSRLQSVLHQDEGMGTINSAVLYAALVLSCLLLPKIVISKLGYKSSIIVCVIGYIIWMAANGIGRWWSMMPASIIVGLSGAPLWTAQCSYFTKLAIRYSKLVGESEIVTVSRFFGIFFMVSKPSSIFGSIISSTVMNQPENGTMPTPSEEVLKMCGIRDCAGNNVTNLNLKKPSDVVVWTLIGVYIAIGVAAVVLVALFMDKFPEELEDEEDINGNFRKDLPNLLLATVRQLRHKTQILLIPLSMYSGLQQGYFNADWTKSFISCGLGIWMVGLVTLPYGCVNAFFSYFTGRIVKYTGRIPIFLSAMCMDIAIQTTLYTWMPHPSRPAVFFVISGCWGFSDAIWKTQINALYGNIFTESEAAFSNYHMWESFGFIAAYSYSSALCTLVKTAVLASVLLLGMSGYFSTEYIICREKSYKVTDKQDDKK